ncbi:hypothetical protein [Aeromonas caviae]|uniref:hypothetical protein n=1 Tax=Aeromonas caviae TaxID=648 RepID=UPI0039F60390
MYKKVKLASIISTLILSATAYSAEMTVGFSQIGSESGWRAAETSVAKSEAQKRGIILKIADAQQKQENQIKAIRSFIAQGVDAIFMVLRGILGKWKLTDRVLVNWLSPNTPPPSPCCRRASY